MKISINAVLERCSLFYFQYFLQLTSELVAIFFIFIGTLRKDAIHAKFGSRTQATV